MSLTNRNETRLLVENWRKVLESGLIDSNTEYLITEGFLSDLGKKLGNKSRTTVFTLSALASMASSAGAYPKSTAMENSYERVLADCANKYDASGDTIEAKYGDVMKSVSIDKVLETLYYIQDAAMKSGNTEQYQEIANIFIDMQKHIKKSPEGRYYLPDNKFDKYYDNNTKLFDHAARAASDVSMGTGVLNTAGAQLIANTTFSGI
jgi:hypothetical protein